MYDNQLIDGSSLPDMTLCLTFDDGPGETNGSGPGPRTLEIAQYLCDQSVPATFFMAGKFASDLPGILSQVESLGHLIGNHTYDHPNLVEYAAAGGNVVSQITRTDGLIRNWIDAPVVCFRPPYGSWNANVATYLNADMTAALSHVGPIGWDIDGGDWASWQNGEDPLMCSTRYLQAIETHEGHRGIVLMHDCTSDMEVVKRANRTFELLQILIPALKQRNYKFVRLDSVPGIKSRTQNFLRVALRGSNGLYVSPQGGGGGKIMVNGPAVGPWESLIAEDLYVGKIALRVMNGKYVSPQNGGGGDVLANGPVVGPWEPFDLISLGTNQIAFRAITGHFLTCAPDNSLNATSWLNLQPSNVFTFEHLL
jgi:peptidoglycan/xylan/chitin deacetylase (PgdA/CDA1 family)